MMEPGGWGALLLSTDAPALPAVWAMQAGLRLGWALLLALGMAWRLDAFHARAAAAHQLPLWLRRALVVATALWTLLPGPLSPAYWLGLAFGMPSLASLLLGAWLLRQRLISAAPGLALLPTGWLLAAVLLGYALLLDTFALLPLQLYAWGFSPLALLVLLALSLWAWLVQAPMATGSHAALWCAPLALLLFAATRLPTGNVWDALLDPWLWLLLQALLLRRLWQRARRSAR